MINLALRYKRERQHQCYANLSDPPLWVDERGDDGGGDVLEVELVTGEGEEGEHRQVQDRLADHGSPVAWIIRSNL